MLHPIVLGKGVRLFPDGVGEETLTLPNTVTFDTRIIILEYIPVST